MVICLLNTSLYYFFKYFYFLFNKHASLRQVFARQEEREKIKEIRTKAEQIVVYW